MIYTEPVIKIIMLEQSDIVTTSKDDPYVEDFYE